MQIFCVEEIKYNFSIFIVFIEYRNLITKAINLTLTSFKISGKLCYTLLSYHSFLSPVVTAVKNKYPCI